MRRILFFLLILIVLGGVAWYVFMRPKQSVTNSTSGGMFQSFFPLGNKQSPAGTIPDSTVPSTQEQTPTPTISSPFKQLSSRPVAGFTTFVANKTITIPATDPKKKAVQQTVAEHFIRYVSRGNGYVYEIKDGSIATQISNIFIPNVYEALFADGGKTALVRFLREDEQTIATYSIPVPDPNPDGTRTQREGVYLPDIIHSLVISPDTKTLARLTDGSDAAIISTSDAKGGAQKEVIRSPFHEWLLSWTNQLYAQTKASASVNGFLYRIDSANKRLVRVLGDIPGLTASTSPKGTYILYSQSSATGFSTKLLTVKTGAVKDLGVSILPEKCVWFVNEDLLCAGSSTVPTAAYPDAWYQGTVSFSDTFYRIYTNAGVIDAISGADARTYDATNLVVDESLGKLYFIDKQTGLLWQFAY